MAQDFLVTEMLKGVPFETICENTKLLNKSETSVSAKTRSICGEGSSGISGDCAHVGYTSVQREEMSSRLVTNSLQRHWEWPKKQKWRAGCPEFPYTRRCIWQAWT